MVSPKRPVYCVTRAPGRTIAFFRRLNAIVLWKKAITPWKKAIVLWKIAIVRLPNAIGRSPKAIVLK
jgi:hypothetical protein